VAYCQSDPADVVIFGLSLPDGDGLAMAEVLADCHPVAKVVVLSGQAASFICPTKLQPLLVAVVDKTAAFQQLQTVLQELLGQSPPNLPPPRAGVLRPDRQGPQQQGHRRHHGSGGVHRGNPSQNDRQETGTQWH
jgi:DNA-binding NarL/FixJ family response regulator